MKLKQFNLKQALAGDKVVTREGSEVKQLVMFDNVSDEFCIAGVVDNTIEMWKADGSFCDVVCGLDLFMVAKETTYYQNVYRVAGSVITLAVHASEKDAHAERAYTMNHYIKTISFTVEA